MDKFLCGVDLGGTKLSVGLVTVSGELLDVLTTHDHINKNCDEIVDCMAVFIKELLSKHQLTEENLAGIGVVFPGHIRSDKGICITTSNLKAGFRNYPIKQKLESYFNQVQVFADNDANAQAYAEYKYGAGIGYDNMIFVTVSTGVGAGILIGGRLFRGKTGTAGEIGHTIIRADSQRQCTCGNHGCVMTESCGLFLPVMARAYIQSGVKNQLGITWDNVDQVLNGEVIKKGIEMEDDLAIHLMKESADAIGAALYNLYQLFGPDHFVLGGGLINWGDPYIHAIQEKFHQMAGHMLFDDILIVTSKIGSHSGVIGASSLPLEYVAIE